MEIAFEPLHLATARPICSREVWEVNNVKGEEESSQDLNINLFEWPIVPVCSTEFYIAVF